MKRTRKTTGRPTRRRIEPEPEENIFNPFAPLLRAFRHRTNRGESPKHPFRDTFITVVLVHVIGVLVFMTYGTVKDSAKRAVSNRTAQPSKDSRVAAMLGRPPELISTEFADPGERLVAVHDEGTGTPQEEERGEEKPKTTAAQSGRASKPQPAQVQAGAPEEPLPPLAAAPPSSKPTAEVRSGADADPLKEAFLTATGRVATTVGKPAPQPEVRKAAPVSEPAPEQATARPKSPALAEYTVQPGDNIFTISRRMNVSFSELAAANNLSSPRDVRVGQVLRSPSGQPNAM